MRGGISKELETEHRHRKYTHTAAASAAAAAAVAAAAAASTSVTSDNDYDDNNRMSTSTMKISLQGASRDVDLLAPFTFFTLGGLHQAIASTFEIDLPSRRTVPDEADKDSNLSFAGKDTKGDNIVLDKGSEIMLALRRCPSTLEITAARKQSVRETTREIDPSILLSLEDLTGTWTNKPTRGCPTPLIRITLFRMVSERR